MYVPATVPVSEVTRRLFPSAPALSAVTVATTALDAVTRLTDAALASAWSRRFTYSSRPPFWKNEPTSKVAGNEALYPPKIWVNWYHEVTSVTASGPP